MHGPERNFDVEVAFDDAGRDPLDEDARARQCRRLCRALAVPARQAGRRHRRAVPIKSVQYQAIAVVTNKTVQEAVRAFGQSPTNYAIERTIDEVANQLGLDRLEVRRRNLIRHEEFPYLIPERLDLRQRRLPRGDRQGAGAAPTTAPARRARPAARRRGCSPASASRRASSRAAATRRSSRCSIRRTPPPPGWIPAASASI